jgi:hypothetical protein
MSSAERISSPTNSFLKAIQGCAASFNYVGHKARQEEIINIPVTCDANKKLLLR